MLFPSRSWEKIRIQTCPNASFPTNGTVQYSAVRFRTVNSDPACVSNANCPLLDRHGVCKKVAINVILTRRRSGTVNNDGGHMAVVAVTRKKGIVSKMEPLVLCALCSMCKWWFSVSAASLALHPLEPNYCARYPKKTWFPKKWYGTVRN